MRGGATPEGAGAEKIMITNAAEGKAKTATPPNAGTNHDRFDRTGYLIHCRKDAKNITIFRLNLNAKRGTNWDWGENRLDNAIAM